ncbi:MULTISPECIES: ParA family protein [unclassified Bacillus cereus group]|uniref:ParA family protein n=1 Tax=unclassified Bacillus cereus group TaxID=2750818 RepID=UPI0029C4A680|nr:MULTISPECIES: ParA family protein [unclassified Bacillus cereus group]MDX5880828.1 ParA family protein [Bacillus cereus group sp. BfR-BA-01042]MDX5906678.1 ParA family protein [Bacillus cereus group sp. BfR-BA-01048]
MTKVVSFYSSKGGAGKSASVLFTANILSEMGHSVLILDMCANGDMSNNFGYNRKDFAGRTTVDWIKGDKTIKEVAVKVENKNIYFVPSDPEIQKLKEWAKKNVATGRNEILKTKLKAFEGVFDFVLLDCHPAQYDFAVRLSLIASQYALVPFQLDGNNKDGAIQAVDVIKELKNKGFQLEYLVLPIAIKTYNFGKDKRLLKRVYEDMENEGVLNRSEIFIQECDYIKEYTLQYKTFEEIASERSTKKVIEQYKKVMKEFLGMGKVEVKL